MRIMNTQKEIAVVLLAAGKGQRMKSPLPKILHSIGGKPLIYHVLKRIQEALPNASVGLVLGHGKDEIEAYLKTDPELSQMTLNVILQAEQKGTGHATRCAIESTWGARVVEKKLPILVLPGDLPLISSKLLTALAAPLAAKKCLRLLACTLEDPTGYGRVVRGGVSVKKIVEEKDASPSQKKIKEVATSIYLFQAKYLKQALGKLSTNNSQGEYYLTDTVELASKTKTPIEVLHWTETTDLRGINDPWELALANELINQRKLRDLAKEGVRILSPTSTWVDTEVVIGAQSVLFPGSVISGKTEIGSGVIVGPHCQITACKISNEAHIKAGTVAEESVIGARCQVGPYAHFRPGSQVGEASKIGNFVELKKTSIGRQTSIAHLSYLGDAQVGNHVNIGCGFVTCNFDGRAIAGERKHKTIIEDEVFMGSDCQTVAPVRISQGAYVASGSTITEDVPPHALAIARSRQVNKLGYAEKLKGGSEKPAEHTKALPSRARTERD